MNGIGNSYFHIHYRDDEKKNSLTKDGNFRGFILIELLKYAYSTTDKIKRIRNSLYPVAGEELIHKNDKDILRLARSTKSIIVTMDEDLIRDIKENELELKYGDTAILPNEVEDFF